MSEEESQIILPKITVEKKEKPFVCPICGKGYKTEKSFLKHLEGHPEIAEDENQQNVEINEINESNDNGGFLSKLSFASKPESHQAKLEKLQKELENLLMSNPSLDISKPCQNTTLEKIYSMSEEELKARIFDAKRGLTNGLDTRISDGVLSFANSIVGNMLGCIDELEECVKNDAALRQAAKDMMSMSVLSYIPPNVKVAGLYAVNVGTAMSKSKAKKVTIVEV